MLLLIQDRCSIQNEGEQAINSCASRALTTVRHQIRRARPTTEPWL